MKFSYLFILSLLFITLSNWGYAQEQCTVIGKITNQNGEAVPYTAIYIESLRRSSMANDEGEFQIVVPQGKYELLFQNLSYETRLIQLEAVGTEKELNVEMRSIAYALKEVEVDPNSEDPAYNIIRKAIAMSEYYKRQRESYVANLYSRTAVNVNEIPWIAKKFAEEDDLKEMEAGYIVETLAEYSYEKGGKVKERIIAQKTQSKDADINGANYVNLDFYDLGGTDIINPLSRSAFAVYKFEYLASIFEEDQKIHKIKIIPRRKGNDLMAGEIYINEQLWNINKVDVNYRTTGTEIFYKQIYREIRENVWFPMNHQIEGKVKIFGFDADFRYLAAIKEITIETDSIVDSEIREKIALQNAKRFASLQLEEEEQDKKDQGSAAEEKDKKLSRDEKREQKINELIEKEKLTKMESLKLYRMIKQQQTEREAEVDTVKSYEISNKRSIIYDDSARAENDSLWQADRQIPLTERDRSIYVKSDSIQKVDNGDTIVNEKRSFFGNLLFFNGRVKTENKAVFLRPRGLLSGMSGYFNTVDGYTITKKLGSFEKNKREGIYYIFQPNIGYAFARERWLAEGSFVYQYKKQSASQLIINGGSITQDFNGEYAMDALSNTIASLFFVENTPKYYQRNYIEIKHKTDIGQKIEFTFGAQYNDREELENNSDQKLSWVGKKKYSENVPEHLETFIDPTILSSHQSAIIEAEISFQDEQYYRFRGGKKYKRNSTSPKFYLGYRQGIPKLFDSDVQFSQIKAGIERSFSYRLIDRISYKIEGGKFLNNDQLYFADYQAFNVNPFEVSLSSEFNSFALLPYYSFNSSDYYIQAHTNVRNNFILLKYLPLLNNTEWKEEIGISYLFTEAEEHYYEFSYGLTEIFLFIDVKAYVSFLNEEYQDFGLRLSFEIDN